MRPEAVSKDAGCVRHWLAPALLIALLALAPAAPAANDPPTLTKIESQVMCPVCGTLLQLAESPQAQREKAFIARLISEGRSEGQIKDALVAEYGNEVLALPQGSGFSLSAYVVPIVAFLVAAVALGFGVMRWRRAGGGGPPDEGRRTPCGPTGEDAERLEADLARYDL
ncbi:MAG TPA: cytochrome c-type biogenesis protein CcmH [Solirubrobacterales bacterium]|nr:cytochrome c-type biogenesis protein CcmH [Solirubrobacterales bacterium]